MNKIRVITITAVALVILALGFGAGSLLASGNAGTRDDPLVTLSYLNEMFLPAVVGQLDDMVSEATEDLRARVERELAERPANTGAGESAFYLVALSEGQTLLLGEGAEALLREGSATVATGSALSNVSVGEAAAAGTDVRLNQMYMAGEGGGGLTAAGQSARFLVRGDYSIS